MKKAVRNPARVTAVWSAAVCLTLAATSFSAATAFAQNQSAQVALSAADKRVVSAFEKRVKEYVRLRERVEGRMSKLSKDATPEQIEAHKKAFRERVRAGSSARAT